MLVSENSTSYGKDLGDLRLLETLLPELAAVDGIERVRVSYLQPAEMRPGLIEVIAGTPGVAPYFDLSFQHASGPVLRRMRRFGDPERFLDLLDQIRDRRPEAGRPVQRHRRLPRRDRGRRRRAGAVPRAQARLDAIGVFGYSDEDGTEAAASTGKLRPGRDRPTGSSEFADLAEELTAQRAEERIGETRRRAGRGATDAATGGYEGRAAHQGPEVDGTTTVAGAGPLVRRADRRAPWWSTPREST